MAFSWQEYIEVAKTLTDVPSAQCLEGKYRAAISRSYYAAYSMTVEYVRDVEKRQFSGTGQHDKLIEYLSLGSDRSNWKKRILDRMRTLKRWRTASDYNPVFKSDGTLNGQPLSDDDLKNYAARAINHAEVIRQTLNERPRR